MKVLLLCLVMVCLSWARNPKALRSLSCDCGWRNVGRIVRGKETDKNEYPWMALLNKKCGASIITRYHVLTAAHCAGRRTDPSTLVVSVGRHYLFTGANEHLQERRVSRIIPHEGYKGDGKIAIHDISILVLATPIAFNQYVGPVCLPTQRFKLSGKYIKVTGWGDTKGTGSMNGLREVDLKVLCDMACRLMIPWTLNKERTQLCTYTNRKNICGGDSGGPLVYLDPETNRYTQVALVSYGKDNCGTFLTPSVHTDVFAYMDWIKKATQQQPKENYCTKI